MNLSTFGLWLLIEASCFWPTEDLWKMPSKDKFSSAPTKMKDSYQRDNICLKLSNCDNQVPYLCTISVNSSQVHQAESPPMTLSTI